MKYFIHCVFVLLFATFHLQAQETIESVIKHGVGMHDRGDYKGAIEQYQKALTINPLSEQAMYEMSFSYLAMEDYPNALKYSTKVINLNYKPLLLDAYNVKGAALASLNKYSEAITLLKEAVDKCGDDYLLYYNLGLSYFKNHDSSNAIVYLEKSIDEKISYSEAYYSYGYALSDQKRWVEAILAFDSFLLLEPDDERAGDVFDDMTDILQNKLTDADSIPNPLKGLSYEKIRATLQDVKKNVLEGTKENDYTYFQEATKSLIADLELMQNEDNEGMFWDYFVPTFSEILDSGYFDTFCRYISVSAFPESLDWWKANPEKAKAFTDWFENTNNSFDDDPEDSADAE